MLEGAWRTERRFDSIRFVSLPLPLWLDGGGGGGGGRQQEPIRRAAAPLLSRLFYALSPPQGTLVIAPECRARSKKSKPPLRGSESSQFVCSSPFALAFSPEGNVNCSRLFSLFSLPFRSLTLPPSTSDTFRLHKRHHRPCPRRSPRVRRDIRKASNSKTRRRKRPRKKLLELAVAARFFGTHQRLFCSSFLCSRPQCATRPRALGISLARL